jgi:GNAT superfamily N-acetyltransferase
MPRRTSGSSTSGRVGYTYQPLTKTRWRDFETLFGKSGGYSGCWCMWWRSSRSEFEARQGAGNKRAMKALVMRGEVPGILAYAGGEAVGWCSIAPRDTYASLGRSRVLKPLDDKPVWSLVCFFIARGWRRRGVTRFLIRAALDYVRKRGGRIVEAYPSVPKSDNVPPVTSFMGFPTLFAEAGFVECARPSAAKVVMRRALRPAKRRG